MTTPDNSGTLVARWLVGSHAYGVADEFSDKDYVEVYAAEPDFVTGIRRVDTSQDAGRGNAEDVTRYELRKWASLVAGGNPNMVETLFLPPQFATPPFAEMLDPGNRQAFLSESAPKKFLAYGASQLMALKGMRNKKTNRPDLIHRHGYDTKWAYHAERVITEGIFLFDWGHLVFPLSNAAHLRYIREGAYSQSEVVGVIQDDLEALEIRMEDYRLSFLPAEADIAKVNLMLHRVYLATWAGIGLASIIEPRN